MSVFVSVVCRLRDDADLVEPVVREISAVLRAHYDNYEIVLVDDGSTDGTRQRVLELLQSISCVRYLRLSRSFGLDIALTAGLETAIGDYVVTLQPESDPPELVPQLVALAMKENAAVYGVVRERPPRGFFREAGSRGFYWACRRLLGLPLQPGSTHLRAMPRHAVNAIGEIKDNARYLRALVPYIGFERRDFPYTQKFRRGAPRAENLFDAVDTAISLVVSNTTRPLRMVSWLALAASGLNGLYIGYVFLVKLVKTRVAEGWMTLSLQNASMFFLLFLILAVVTEYVGRILNETRERPLYYVAEEQVSSVLVADPSRRNVVTESR